MQDEVVSTINTTPLVDVMLVLLNIFLITMTSATQIRPHSAAQAGRRAASPAIRASQARRGDPTRSR
jgi:biopolymer transport protein ExbD